MTVSINANTLAPGVYCDTIVVSSTNADNSPQKVVVCYTVTPGPHINLSPTTLNFTATQNGALPPSQTFTISNTTGCTLNWKVLKDVSWLSILPADSGNSNNQIITVSVTTTDLAPTTHIGTITVTSNNADNSGQTVTVSYNLSPD